MIPLPIQTKLTTICVVALVSCQTPRKQPVEQKQELQSLPLPLVGDVPEHFWSPNQRQINAIYNYLVGEYTLLKGDVHTSHSAFAKAYSLDPNPFLGGKSIFTLAELGHTDRALVESKKMVLLHPKDAYLQFLHGQILVRSGYMEEAKKQLEKALHLNQFHIPSYHALIDLHIVRNQLHDALVIAKEMVRKIPSAVLGWSKLSRIYLLLGQKKAALKPARTAFYMQSSNPAFILIYAYSLELNGFSKEAVAMYEKLYQGNAANEQFIQHLASLYRQLGGLQQALELLHKLASRTEKVSVGVNIQRVIIMWELQRNEQAREILLEILQEHPRAGKIIYLAGLSEERLENYQAAISYYRQLRQDEKLAAAAGFRLALIYRRQGETELAIAEMHRVLDYPHTKWQFFALLADIYQKRREYKQALQVTVRGQEKHPRAVPLIFLQGVYQEKTGDIAGCMQSMREVIELDPMHSSAHNYLGYLLAEQNTDLQEALRLIQRALQLKPNNGYYLDSLAWVYYRLGMYDKAHTSILKALQLHPQEAVILEHYADILLKLNRPAQGLLIYHKALRYFNEAQDKKRVEDKIKILEQNS